MLFFFKGLLLKAYLASHGCKVGTGLKCRSFPSFRRPPSGNMTIGNSVTIGSGVTFHPEVGGMIILGNRVNLSQNIIISSSSRVILGDDTLVAENVSIRDGDHGISCGELIRDQATVTEEILIGKDVWICAGSIILKGAMIADGAIIGANSVVTRKCHVDSNGVYAGMPVKLIKLRE